MANTVATITKRKSTNPQVKLVMVELFRLEVPVARIMLMLLVQVERNAETTLQQTACAQPNTRSLT